MPTVKTKKIHYCSIAVDTTAYDFDPIVFSNFLSDVLQYSSHVYVRKKNEDGVDESYHLWNIIASFDTETSSFKIGDSKNAILTCWQICINGTCFLGRDWTDFDNMMNILESEMGLSCGTDGLKFRFYVHNLSYDFGFISSHIFKYGCQKVFALKNRKVLLADTGTVQFADSLALTNMSLDLSVKNFVKHFDVSKQVGLYDYKLIRSSQTPLTQDEKNYCVYDVLCVVCLIAELVIERCAGLLSRLPMTSTGFVRKNLKSVLLKDNSYIQTIHRLKLYPDDLKLAEEAYQGGFTHGSCAHAGQFLLDVKSYDFTSSYPATLCCFKYPMSSVLNDNLPSSLQELYSWCDKYFVMMKIRLKNVRDKIKYEHIISLSKCEEIESPVVDNGRIVSADMLVTSITKYDLYNINMFYEYDEIEIIQCYRYAEDYLPTPLVKMILAYFSQKNKLKGVDGMESLYTYNKQLLNAIYGDFCLKIIRPESKFNWQTCNWEEPEALTDEYIEKSLRKYNDSKYRYNFFLWGVACSAIARHNLLKSIAAIGDIYVYSDTDSMKYIDTGDGKVDDYVNRYNKYIENKMVTAMAYHKAKDSTFDDKAWLGCDKNGKEHRLGYWDFDGAYTRGFKALRAKCYVTANDDGITCTIAGTNKKTTSEWFNELGIEKTFEMFDDEMVIPKEHTNRMSIVYLDGGCKGSYVDYLGNAFDFEESSAVYMEESEYRLNLTDPFLKYFAGEYESVYMD